MSDREITEHRLNGATRYAAQGDPDCRAYETREQAEQRADALDHPITFPPTNYPHPSTS